MSTKGLTLTGVPPQPPWLFFLKLVILVLALVILALSAWAVSLGTGGYGGFLIFVVSARPSYVSNILSLY
jgi:hypothetical protein